MPNVNDVTIYRDEVGTPQPLPTALVTAVANAIAGTQAINSLGYQQLTSPQLQTVQPLSPPAGSKRAHVQSNGGSAVRYREDGGTPQPMMGMLLEPNDERDFSGDLTKVSFIDAGQNAVLDITYYG